MKMGIDNGIASLRCLKCKPVALVPIRKSDIRTQALNALELRIVFLLNSQKFCHHSSLLG